QPARQFWNCVVNASLTSSRDRRTGCPYALPVKFDASVLDILGCCEEFVPSRREARVRLGEPGSRADSTMRRSLRRLRAASGQFGADLLAQPVDQDQLAAALDLPERPAVPGPRAPDRRGGGKDLR